MALIPLKDEATIKSGSNIDAWGNPTYSESKTVSCRIDEGTKLTRDKNGYEVVSDTQILLNGAEALSYDDEISWTDSTGVTRSKKAIKISVIKDISSKVLFTKAEL